MALGGGGGLGSERGVTQSVLEESLPVQDELGNWTLWRVRARNDAAAAQTLSAQDICGEEPDKYEVIAKPETVAAGTDSKVEHKPSCPAGSLALSGGAGLTTDIERDTGTQIVMHESTPTTAEAGSESQQWLTLPASQATPSSRSRLRRLRKPAALTPNQPERGTKSAPLPSPSSGKGREEIGKDLVVARAR